MMVITRKLLKLSESACCRRAIRKVDSPKTSAKSYEQVPAAAEEFINSDSDELLVRYHLGELSPEEREAVEDLFFADDAFHEQVLAAEEELIDSYVHGELSTEQNKHFEDWFLQADDRRQKLEFAKALARYDPAHVEPVKEVTDPYSEKALVRYHLGELSPEERDAVEDRYFADDAFHERVLAVEEELIDSYVRDELSAEQRKHFESWFLPVDDRRERLEFAKTLAGAFHNELETALTVRSQRSRWSGFWSALLGRKSKVEVHKSGALSPVPAPASNMGTIGLALTGVACVVLGAVFLTHRSRTHVGLPAPSENSARYQTGRSPARSGESLDLFRKAPGQSAAPSSASATSPITTPVTLPRTYAAQPAGFVVCGPVPASGTSGTPGTSLSLGCMAWWSCVRSSP
jgi:anti-sigma-K factor RskA